MAKAVGMRLDSKLRQAQMKTATVAFEKLYWIAVATVPWFPIYVLGTFNPQPECVDSENCLHIHFGLLLNREGKEIIFLVVFLLWPICAWNIAGKHLWPWINKHIKRYRSGLWSSARQPAPFNSGIAAIFLAKLYWLAVTCVPLFLWYLFGTLRSPSECVDNGTCFQYFLPLNDVSAVAVFLAGLLLWPMCAWQLAGNYIWLRIQSK
jgi:hypothetical protein